MAAGQMCGEHIIEVYNGVILDFQQVQTLFYVPVFILERRKGCKVVHSTNTKHTANIFSLVALRGCLVMKKVGAMSTQVIDVVRIDGVQLY